MHFVLNHPNRVLRITAAMMPLIALTGAARADIFRWEYIDLADPSQGKRQSTMLAHDGAGVDAVPGADLSYRDLTMAYLVGVDFTNAFVQVTNLTNADLSQANLTNAYFYSATLTGADFSDAEVRGARFGKYYCCGVGTGLALAQLYSTSSYKAHDLSGIHIDSDLAGADFAGQNLSSSNFGRARLTGANFRQANLADAEFNAFYESCSLCTSPGSRLSATLTDADFANSRVQGASFAGATASGFAAGQLYSTASYQGQDLSGIDLSSNDLSGWNFAGQILSNAGFEGATMKSVDFANAQVQGANFVGATLSDAEFRGADVRGASFAKSYHLSNVAFPGYGPFPVINGTGISPAQLYSTSNYQDGDLSGINFGLNDLTGGNFADQNLTNARFGGATLTFADFAAAEIRGASFDRYELCDFSFNCQSTSGITAEQLYSTASYEARDLRGVSGLDLSNAITTNLILPNGHIDGLDLDGGGQLVLHDYDGDYDGFPSPVLVDQHLAMGPEGTMRMVFEGDAWDSTISFVPGIQVALGGRLELFFAADVNVATQVGRTFYLFDWTGVHPTGTFGVFSTYAWNLSELYTRGEVTLTAVPEPTSIALAAVSAFGLTIYSMRKIP